MEKPKMEIPKLSSTRLNTYLTCGMRYWFRYVKDLVVPPTSALTLGTTVHMAVGFSLKHKSEQQEAMPEDDVLDYFGTVFDLEKSKTMWFADENPGKIKDMGYGLVECHYQLVSPHIMPLAIEKGFLLSLVARKDPDEDPEKPARVYPPIEGWVDAVDQDGRIIETKTTKSKPRVAQAAHQLQTTVYAAGMRFAGVNVPGGRIDYLVKTKKKQAVSFEVGLTKADWMYFETALDTVVRGIENDIFLPNRDFFGCSRRNCGFWSMCEKAKGGRVKD